MDTGMDSVLQSFWNAIDHSGRNYNREKIEAAYKYANELHKGQKRQSGEPYITHPVAVAEIVAGLGLDTDSICAALLHERWRTAPTRPALPSSRRNSDRASPCWWTV